MTIQAQGSWESYNHDYLINKPITSYPYNGGIVMISTSGATYRFVSSTELRIPQTNIEFIDSEGSIHNLGKTNEFYGDPINDIKFVENQDS